MVVQARDAADADHGFYRPASSRSRAQRSIKPSASRAVVGTAVLRKNWIRDELTPLGTDKLTIIAPKPGPSVPPITQDRIQSGRCRRSMARYAPEWVASAHACELTCQYLRDSADGANRHAHRLKKAPASVKSGTYCRGPGIRPWLESLS
jgi:hypothetical protein